MIATINYAIFNRHLVGFYYQCHYMIVEPYLYGADKAGRQFLFGFQTGHESSAELTGWYLFEFSKISGIQLLDQQFSQIRYEYVIGKEELEIIFKEIEF